MTSGGESVQYFADLDRALRANGVSQPVLVVDRGRLDQNLDTLASTLPSGKELRIVAKSLPSTELLRHVMGRLGAQRLMTFNLAMLTRLSKDFPDVDQLLGKPFPVAAARDFISHSSRAEIDRAQWLIDTNARLEQYEDLARSRNAALRVSLELDIGLHRGGFVPDEHLRAALHRIETSDVLELSGFVGYEAHVAKFPTAGRLRARAFEAAMTTYEAAVHMAVAIFGTDIADRLVRNSAGSMTYRLHDHDSIANEISVGTAVLKGTDFDLGLLEDFVPAVFIATPVLKVLPRTELPGIEVMGRAAARLRRQPHHTVFIHGGHWLADPVFPPGLSTNALYGRSSNQEMLSIAAPHGLAPDDFVFLRPTQTEAVMLQFGPLAVYEDGEIVDEWPVFEASA